MTAAHPAFEFLGERPIPSLRLEVQTFRHRRTGALHYHLAADDVHNVFLVAFRTVPMDSTGVAHILEHTSLCGSERFPVRDPFFMMTRRSLNTFMNAFTSGDWTAYPFASQNRKDFDNLLAVYLDAAFFPRLDPLDFAQEGHRLEFATPGDPGSDLTIKGIVFNEMKGALSAPVRSLWERLSHHLFPSTTYHYNSGGEPADIPSLTHAQLVEFHRTHYHPSNAIFMTYGDVPATERQAQFEALALGRFDAGGHAIAVGDERRYAAPLAVEERYALEGEEDTAAKTHIVLGWLLGRSTDLDAVLEAHLLSGVLLDNSASPLRHALETTELGTAPSGLCGLEDSPREMMFVCGLEGSEPARAEAVEALILDTLRRVADAGIDQDLVEAVLHQLELSQREIGGDHYPYGLQLMLNAMGAAVHGADPAEYLDLDPALERLRERVRDPSFLPGLVRRWLLENAHRVRLSYRPDTELGAERERAERERLAALKSTLDEDARRRIVAQAAALEARQQRRDDPDLLPKVGLSDVPADLPIPEGSTHRIAGCEATFFAQGTNGLVYEELILDLPRLDDDLVDALPLFTLALTEVGVGARDYLATQALAARVTGGIGAGTALRGRIDTGTELRALLTLSSKALARNQRPMTELLFETHATARFDEHRRLRELIAQSRAHAEQAVTGSGHMLAMTAAASGLAPAKALGHRLRGLAGMKTLKAIDDGLKKAADVAPLAARLEALRERFRAAPRRALLIAEAEHREALLAALDAELAKLPAASAAEAFRAPWQPRAVREAWITNTQVQFCARAYAATPPAHPDTPAWLVLGNFLRNGYLHRAIREQGGAYGGGAGYDGDSATFRFYSYRDPRLADTLADFDRAIDWLLDTPHEFRTLEEAILGVISRIDQPGSPAGEARSTYHAALHGRTPEHRRRLREGVLRVTLDDLRRVASTHLDPARAHTAVICPPSARDAAVALGLEPVTL